MHNMCRALGSPQWPSFVLSVHARSAIRALLHLCIAHTPSGHACMRARATVCRACCARLPGHMKNTFMSAASMFCAAQQRTPELYIYEIHQIDKNRIAHSVATTDQYGQRDGQANKINVHKFNLQLIEKYKRELEDTNGMHIARRRRKYRMCVHIT